MSHENETQKQGKTRSTNLEKRGDLYKSVIEHINSAMESGFYLEAITLYESLICDRLESRISYLKGRDFSYKTLEKNLEEIRKLESDETIKSLAERDGEIDRWKNERNKAIHELAKLQEGETETFAEKYAALKRVAEEGRKVFRSLDRQVASLRKKGI